MLWLVVGLILWIAVHLSPSLLPSIRAGLVGSIGEKPYKGVFAIAVVGAHAVIVYGWQLAVTDNHYQLATKVSIVVAGILILLASVLIVVGSVALFWEPVRVVPVARRATPARRSRTGTDTSRQRSRAAMTSVEIGIYSILAILVLIYSGMYVPVVLGLVSFVGVWAIKGRLSIAVKLLTLAASDSIASYLFGVIPLFVLMGLLVGAADMGTDAFAVANQAFRRVRAGLGIATAAANAIFAAITGISIASAAIFTRVAVPEMLRYGYRPRFAVGVVAGSSILGMLIAPSLLLILYAVLTEQSVGDMFLAGVIPGILLSLAFCAAILGFAWLAPSMIGGEVPQDGDSRSLMSRRQMIGKLAPILVLVVMVIGGIYGGVFTPTEAGAAGALGALVIAIAKRKLDLRTFWGVLIETGHITASICFLVIAASMYSRMLGLSGIAMELGDFVQHGNLGLYGLLAVYVVLLLVLGTVLDSTSIILILVPLFLPMLAPFGVDLVWFGIITVIGVEIGLLTPPLGIAAYVIKSTLDSDEISLFDIFAGAFPFAVIMLLMVILIIAVPDIVLALL